MTSRVRAPRFAASAEHLKTLMEAAPESSPTSFLHDDSLASALYDRCSVEELKAAFQRDPDPRECRRYGLNATQWKEQVAMALVARGVDTY